MKTDYIIRRERERECIELLEKFHYLSVQKISKGIKSGINYVLDHVIDGPVGCAIFTGFPVPELSKGLFGLDRNNQDGFFELSRLVLHPEHQKKELCLASWFLSRAIKILCKETNVRAILSYADSGFHNGTVYAACNFKYYGLTAEKNDFFRKIGDEYVKVSRGKVKGLEGEWRPRNRKHRFLIVKDSNLIPLWKEEKWDRNN